MLAFSSRIVQRPPAVDKIVSNINFGVAMGLTKTAKDGQAAVVSALGANFTLRGNWWQQSNRFGIKIKPATKYDLQSEVRTMADWLIPHEEGKAKVARSGQLAVPTDQVRRTKRMVIPRGQRPRGLGAKVFVLQTKHGPVLAQRLTRGKRKGLVVLYGLERSVKIKKVSTFHEPIRRVVAKNLTKNVAAGIKYALETMR